MSTLAFQDAGLKCSFHLSDPVKGFWQQQEQCPLPATKKVAYCSENNALIQCAFREYSHTARFRSKARYRL